MRFHRLIQARWRYAAPVLLMLAVCVSCLPGLAQTNVTVVNSPSNPVRVSGSVNAAVTGNVGIVGTPTVGVQSSSAPATIINGQTITPVVVRNMDESARHPFQHSFSCVVSPSAGVNCSDHFTVPTGKELVIEYVQFYGLELGGNIVVTYLLNTSVGGVGNTYYYPRGTATWSNIPVTHELTRIYADPGSTVTFTGVANSNIGMSFSATVSGYLIDVP